MISRNLMELYPTIFVTTLIYRLQTNYLRSLLALKYPKPFNLMIIIGRVHSTFSAHGITFASLWMISV